MEESNSNYKLEKSKTGKDVPVINGVYLHSIYDPEKEAQTLIEKSSEAIKTKNYVLVFGLGYGYHIDALVKALTENHQHFEVVVIEPNTGLIEDFLRARPIEDERIQILNIEKPNEAYEQEVFVEFLMNKPCIIKHETSFSINNEFFTNFLMYKAPTKVSDYSHLLIEQSRSFINVISEESLTEHAQLIADSAQINSKQDYLTLALNSIINN